MIRLVRKGGLRPTGDASGEQGEMQWRIQSQIAYGRELEDGDGRAVNPLRESRGMGGRRDPWPVNPGADFFAFVGCKMGSQFL